MSSRIAHLLIVDDDPDICNFMQTALELSSYHVDTLSDPTKVLDQLRTEEYHLLIIDLMMPQLDGISLIEQIRKQDSDIAIMIFTGYPSVESAVEALKLQVSDYLKKPFDLEELRTKIAEVLRKKGLLRDPEADLHRSIGQAIRQERKAQELTLKQLARRTGLSVSLLSQIERAESSASVGSLYKIASALGISLTQLFSKF